MIALALLAAGLMAHPAPDSLAPLAPTPTAARADSVPAVVELSDAYYRRLEIHRFGSYAMLPLFGAQYLLGSRLISPDADPRWVRTGHVVVGAGVGTLFAANTVTGLWNLWEARGVPEGRRRRVIHAVGMLAADAGFVATGLSAREAVRSGDGADRHRALAIGSMSVAAASALMMYLWED